MNTKTKPKILNFSGSDSSGLAGLQMDLKTQQAMGVHSLNVVTAVTAQNNQNVISINPVCEQTISDQITALDSISFNVIKSGLLANQFQIKKLVSLVNDRDLPLICDPVFAATSGTNFTTAQLSKKYIEEILPHCFLITPNIPEAEQLTGKKIRTRGDMEIAARLINELGAKNVYIKGGHFIKEQDASKNNFAMDFFLSCEETKNSFWLSSPWVATKNTRGTGCAFASSVAATIALGYTIKDAVVIGKMSINQGLRQSYSIGSNNDETLQKGPINITKFPNSQKDLPILTQTPNQNLEQDAFPSCTEQGDLGLYPVVDSVEWLKRLLPLGVSTAQIRIKNLDGDALEEEIRNAIALGREFNCRLFINDYWKLAVKHQAYGVHLGQEDLDTADIKSIFNAGLRLGTSTHCHYEVARAIAHKPSYIACGPVYETTTKIMPWVPHGIDGLNYWNKLLDYPVVAIGGINHERLKSVIATKTSGVAMITAITLADNPEVTTKVFMKEIDQFTKKRSVE